MADARLKATLTLEDGEFVRGLARAQGSAKQFGKNASVIFGDVRSQVRAIVAETDRLAAATKKAEQRQRELAASFAQSRKMQAAQAAFAMPGYGAPGRAGKTSAGASAAGAFAGASLAPIANEFKKSLGKVFDDSVLDPLADIAGGAVAGGVIGGAPGAAIGAGAGAVKSIFGTVGKLQDIAEARKELAKAFTGAEIAQARAGKTTLAQQNAIEDMVENMRAHEAHARNIASASKQIADNYDDARNAIALTASIASAIAGERGARNAVDVSGEQFGLRTGARGEILRSLAAQQSNVPSQTRTAMDAAMRRFQEQERLSADVEKDFTPAQKKAASEARRRSYEDEVRGIREAEKARMDSITEQMKRVQNEETADAALHAEKMKTKQAETIRQREQQAAEARAAGAQEGRDAWQRQVEKWAEEAPREGKTRPEWARGKDGKRAKMSSAAQRELMEAQRSFDFETAFRGAGPRSSMRSTGRLSDADWRKQFEAKPKAKPIVPEGAMPKGAVDKAPVKIDDNSITKLIAGIDRLILQPA